MTDEVLWAWKDWIARASDADLWYRLDVIEKDYLYALDWPDLAAFPPNDLSTIYNIIEEELIKRGLV